MTLIGPFQPKLFYNSMILFYKNAAPGKAAGPYKKGDAPQPAFPAPPCPPHNLVMPIVYLTVEGHSQAPRVWKSCFTIWTNREGLSQV